MSSTVIAFVVGVFLSGVVLAIVFGDLYLEAEEKAYKKGYEDGRNIHGKGSKGIDAGSERNGAKTV